MPRSLEARIVFLVPWALSLVIQVLAVVILVLLAPSHQLKLLVNA
jgi:hypothetical protein